MTFAQGYQNVSFLEGKIAMCVTQVDPDFRDDPDMQGEPTLVIKNLKEISKSLLMNSKAK